MTNGGHPDDGGSAKPVVDRPGSEKKRGEKTSAKSTTPTSSTRGKGKPSS